MEKEITEIVNGEIHPESISNLRLENDKCEGLFILFDFGENKGDILIKENISEAEVINKVAGYILNSIAMWKRTQGINHNAKHLLDF